MDWQQTTLNRAGRDAFIQLIRTPADKRDPRLLERSVAATESLFALLDRQLADRAYICGERFTMADIPLGCEAHRWFNLPRTHASWPHVERWYAALRATAGHRHRAGSVASMKTAAMSPDARRAGAPQISSRPPETLGLLRGLIGVLAFSLTLPMTRFAVAELDPWFLAVRTDGDCGSDCRRVARRNRCAAPRTLRPRVAGLERAWHRDRFSAAVVTGIAPYPANHGAIIVGLLPSLPRCWRRWCSRTDNPHASGSARPSAPGS